ncbi:glycine--tRNA ligase [candidate division WWE3 bacterium CG_4_10_14_0_2_um_filter_47_8]|nr:MAG: glycine--tRNA ligase [candidate division WWE3 bacterium CG_4_10_14_0_2_um_filter_47_8]
MEKTDNRFEQIVSLAKRRGFIYPSSEIYGGLSGFWDFGPLGVELKNNLKSEWWGSTVWEKENVVGLDSSIIYNPKVWEVSGHTKHFADPLVECKNCHQRFKADQLTVNPPKARLAKGGSKQQTACPNCGKTEFTEPKMFNLMFKTHVGPVEDEASAAYLRPETAQGIFINFENILKTSRLKLPFGIAQIGKAFRNEITTGNFIFRSREFEQAELEWFCKPKEAEKWFKYWQKERLGWYLRLGMKRKNLRWREHEDRERAHYAVTAFDIEYNFPFGWGEIEGIANRSDYDLKAHKLKYRDEEMGKEVVPYVIEPSMGIERPAFAFLLDAYFEETVRGEKRVVLKLHPKLAPIKVAVLPLVRTDKSLVKIAKEIFEDLKGRFNAAYDEVGSIGRRYRRGDEAGTPFAVTVDAQTTKDKTVTVRERDSMKQKRVAIEELPNYLTGKLL